MQTGEAFLGDIDHLCDLTALPRLAVYTCDIEQDFGGRTGSTELLDNRKHLDELCMHCKLHDVPLSGFVVTSLLKPTLVQCITDNAIDMHAHSHMHDVETYADRSQTEIQKSFTEFQQHFGRAPLGYRAPQGVFCPGDAECVQQSGYQFSASIFPAFRRKVFDYRSFPRTPWRWSNGLLEIPFATAEKRRQMLTISYAKLWGMWAWNCLLADETQLPQIVVIDSHLHDFFTPSTFGSLPLSFRLAYSRNRNKGFKHSSWLIETLKKRGYHFVTMTRLYGLLNG